MSIDLSKYAGHTPGAWSVNPMDAPCEDNSIFAPTLASGQRQLVATVSTGSHAPANARLIADAPALLAALAAEQARAERLADALLKICKRAVAHPDDDDADRKRNLYLVHVAARAALALRPSGDGVG